MFFSGYINAHYSLTFTEQFLYTFFFLDCISAFVNVISLCLYLTERNKNTSVPAILDVDVCKNIKDDNNIANVEATDTIELSQEISSSTGKYIDFLYSTYKQLYFILLYLSLSLSLSVNAPSEEQSMNRLTAQRLFADIVKCTSELEKIKEIVCSVITNLVNVMDILAKV